MVPLVDPLVGTFPIGGPCEVGGVDVGGYAFFETVQLVGADEVHLAREHGAIPGKAQVMGKCRRGGGKLARVIPRADRGNRLARQHREPRGSTQRRVAVRIVESGPSLSERIEVRSFHDLVPIGRRKVRRELIGHHHQDVWSPHGQTVPNELNARSIRAMSNYLRSARNGKSRRTCSTRSRLTSAERTNGPDSPASATISPKGSMIIESPQ